LRTSKKMPGQNRIYTAGEKEYEAGRSRAGKGAPVNAELQQEIAVMMRELNLDNGRYGFSFIG
jgi:LDH2 family malate/lactate/ureidoglycolate dehydrogenase